MFLFKLDKNYQKENKKYVKVKEIFTVKNEGR